MCVYHIIYVYIYIYTYTYIIHLIYTHMYVYTTSCPHWCQSRPAGQGSLQVATLLATVEEHMR